MESANLETFFDTRLMEVKYLSNNRMVQELFHRYKLETDNDQPDFQMENTRICNFFADLIRKSKDIRDVFVISPHGKVIASNRPEALWIDLSERQYFLNAMNGKATISNLIRDKVDGNSVVFVAAPIIDENSPSIIGVMATIIDMNNTSDSMRELVDPSIGNAYLVDESGMIVFHTDKSLIGTKNKVAEIDTFLSDKRIKTEGDQVFSNKGANVFLTYKSIHNTQWKLVIEQNMNVLMGSANNALYVMISLAIGILLISGWIAIRYAHSITRPITEISGVMNKATQGDLGVRVDYVSNNELGKLSTDLNYMLDELIGAYEELETKNEELLATEEELRINYEELDHSQKELRIIQDKYVMALKGAKDAVWEWDYANNHFFVSEMWITITGKTTYCDTIKDVVFEEILDAPEKVRVLSCFKAHWDKKMEDLELTFLTTQLKGKNARFVIRANTVWDEFGKRVKTTGILADITEQEEAKARIHNLAFVNQLTDIPNRTAFLLTLQEQIKDKNGNENGIALFLLDIDNFKRINDSLGHSMGDYLLKEVGIRLKELENDTFKAFHLSGDSFAFILSNEADRERLDEKAQKIIETFHLPFLILNRSINISVSVGISTYPKDTDTAEKLIQNADMAMYNAKESGKAQFIYFTEIMSETVMKRVDIEEVLRRAVEDGLIFMHYQPQYVSEGQKLLAFEALMRIRKEDGTYISPSEFIPVAEEIGLIIQLGEWALYHVCETIKKWTGQGYLFSHVSINVSGIQLKQKDFSKLVDRIVDETGIEPGQLELEITETILLDIIDEKIEMLSIFKQKGYKIALDDFGTGYSSFSYLRKMPLNTLKIDKSFIDEIESSNKDLELVRQIIEIAHEMELLVVAEGVERMQQYEILCNIKCDYIQGYFFNRPLPLAQAEYLLSN